MLHYVLDAVSATVEPTVLFLLNVQSLEKKSALETYHLTGFPQQDRQNERHHAFKNMFFSHVDYTVEGS